MAQNKKEGPDRRQSSSPMLERFLQRSMTDYMQHMDEESLAKAIKTLLYEEKSKKHLN